MHEDLFEIRPVKLDDVAELRSNCFTMNTIGQVQEMVSHNLERDASGEGTHLVAESAGSVVGTVYLEMRQHELAMHRAVVKGLVVSHAYTRRGIARMLVQACKKEAAKRGCTILEIGCRAGELAEVIYPRLGFVEYGRLPKGLKETWGACREYDEVLYYMPM